MKKKTLVRIGFLALVLCLITAALLSVTLARYSSTVTGGGNAAVASWSFTTNTKTDKFDFTMVGTGGNQKIVPGDSGTIVLTLNNGGEVSADYEIKLSTLPSGNDFAFKLTDNDGALITSANSVKGVLAAGGTKVVTLYWSFNSEAANTAAGVTHPVEITVTGAQSNPANKAAADPAVVPAS